jgi:methylated-DNA-[protein]-cysteine S-methyltransferase
MAEPLSLFVDRLHTPIGEMVIVVDGDGHLRATDWTEHEHRMWRLLGRQNGDLTSRAGRAPDISKVIARYFDGDLAAIDEIPVRFGGTPFQRDVWNALRRIPTGSTVSYGKLAMTIGRPAAVRAVGAANGANPIGVVVPCHRVIGADGSLTGYGGGIERKVWLLRHESAEIGLLV